MKNELLSSAGSIEQHIFFIQQGSVRVFFVNEGVEQNVRLGYSGNVIAALDSFFTGNPSQFSIEAVKKTTVLRVGKGDFHILIKELGLERSWMGLLEQLVVQQLEREMDLLIDSPSERIARVLKRSPRLFQEIPHRHIANYLRMSPETLSRIKKS
jgi:CRP-like cAMP-binding protein